MSLSSRRSLRPLTIPDIDSERALGLEISSGSCRSNHRCTSLKADCLQSPVDPATWEGASSLARFGLDIGGTLCKVVYFEPFDHLQSCTASSKFGPRNAVESVRVSITETESARRCSDKHVSDSSVRLIEGDAVQGKKAMILDDQQPDHENLEEPCMSEDRWAGFSVSGEEPTAANVKHFKQVPKIWVSSHDPVPLPGRGTLYFKCFETWRMEEFLLLTREHSLVTRGRALGATGGGARKFGHQFLGIAGLKLKRADELKSLVRGIDFLMKHAQHESFEYPKGSFQGGVIQRPFKSPDDISDDGDSDISEEESWPCVNHFNDDRPESKEICLSINNPHGSDKLDKAVGGKRTRGTVVPSPILTSQSGESLKGNLNLYPYLVVNIGSGVSMLLVDSPEQFQRVGGTSLGGSTFFGLASILTGCDSFEEAIDLAAEGDSTEIDMLVGDIYGGDYSQMGLAATTVASSFGKLVQPQRRAAALKNPQHLAKATLLMITNNIGSLAKLHAQATGVDRVLFTGSFMHGNKLAMRLLAVAMEFWSKGQIKAIFLQHEGHAGAMGALLSALNPKDPTDALLLN